MSITFNELPQKEKEILLLIPAKAAILVGGADEDFDKIEQKVARELTRTKPYTTQGDLKNFYSIVSERFTQDINDLMVCYPENTKERNDLIKQDIIDINPVLDKLGPAFKNAFTNTILELAHYVADASGGIFSILSINHEERKEIDNLSKILKEQVV